MRLKPAVDVATPATMRGDLFAGITSAVVMAAVGGSFGLLALAPLGTAAAPLAFVWGVYASVLANVVPLLCGARGPMLGGPTARWHCWCRRCC